MISLRTSFVILRWSLADTLPLRLSLIVKEELVPLLLAVLQVSLDPNGASTRRITNSSLHHLIGQLFVHEETELVGLTHRSSRNQLTRFPASSVV